MDILRCLDFKKPRNFKDNAKFFSQSYLFLSYIGVKILYGLSILFQIWFLSFVFQDEYKRDFNIGFFETSLTVEERFPRVIFCKIDLLTTYDIQRHWVQCVLPDNVYIEKAYIIIVNWLYVIFILNVLSLIFHLQFIFKRFRNTFILSKLNEDDNELSIDGDEFTDMFTVDCTLALRLINQNTYDFKVTAILKSLYRITEKKKRL